MCHFVFNPLSHLNVKSYINVPFCIRAEPRYRWSNRSRIARRRRKVRFYIGSGPYNPLSHLNVKSYLNVPFCIRAEPRYRWSNRSRIARRRRKVRFYIGSQRAENGREPLRTVSVLYLIPLSGALTGDRWGA